MQFVSPRTCSSLCCSSQWLMLKSLVLVHLYQGDAICDFYSVEIYSGQHLMLKSLVLDQL